MNKITALIVDDEADGRSSLRCYLEQHCPEVVVTAEAGSVREAATEIAANNPALVFLDINMPFENGFALFDHFPHPHFHTIFVTAYDSYALQAIKQHALDYLLKPVNIDELIAAVRHAARRISETQAATDNGDITSKQQVSQMLKDMPRMKGTDKIALAVLDGFVYVPPAEIVRCEAKGNYTNFHFVSRPQLLVCRSIGYYEALLEPCGFIRVHHQHMINLAHIERYQRGRGGVVIMGNNSEVPISHRRKDDFLTIIGRYGT